MVDDSSIPAENTTIFKLVITTFVLITIYSLAVYIFGNLDTELSKAILAYIDVLIWPTVTVAMLLTFKADIAVLLSNSKVKTIGAGSISVEGIEPNQKDPEKKVDTNTIENFDAVAKEESENSSEQLRESENTIWRLNLELDFERIYNYIFRGQIILLNKLITNGSMSWQQVEGYFFLESKKDPAAFKGWDAAKYIEYLTNNELISIEDKSGLIQITKKGQVFIAYLNANKYQKLGI